ncbi:MAG TPA: hypothetical protein VL096_02955, partial [Pirellulaceae bacterium]|nr:hypothetical protein [Pirellulaceae bacterium]
MASEIAYRRLRAPREHGQTLIEPSLDQLPQCVRQNIAASSQAATIEINGRRLAEFSAAARVEVIQRARAYSSAYLDLPDLTAHARDAPLVMAGHQPQLFHAGVWFKNFVLSGVAQRVEGVAINLVVDNDTSRVAALRMPTGPATSPRVVGVPFDATAAEIPYEERPVVDPALFASFATRTTHTLAGWIDDPLVNQLWPAAVERAEATNNLGFALASARHKREQAWGLRTLELPLSQVCDTASFAAFALHLLVAMERFHSVYNGALADYRRVHHLRGSSHPVPDLHVADSMWEAPLWIWSAAEPRRRPLYIERKHDALELSNRAGTTIRLPLTNGEVTESTIDA